MMVTILVGLHSVCMISIISYAVSYFSLYSLQSHGVPQLFGVYYGLGFALIFQGLLSSFYHFCPNGSNFGFGKIHRVSMHSCNPYMHKLCFVRLIFVGTLMNDKNFPMYMYGIINFVSPSMQTLHFIL